MKQTILKILERYLLGLARVVLGTYKPTIIGITGSVGKTTTKEALAHVLKANGLHLRKTEANLNADLGIALTVLGYDHSPAVWEWPIALVWLHVTWLLMLLHILKFPPYFIVEMGVDRLGDMERILQTIRPTIGIVTWIGEGHHLEFFKDAATVAEQKGQMLAVLPKNGLAIIPGTDPNVKILEQLASAPVVKIKATGQEAVGEIVQAVAAYLKLPNTDLADFKNPKGRLQILKGINGSTLIDDSYNSSFPAAKLALDFLNQQSGQRKIAVLGDILEQGDQEATFHEQIARLAKQKADLLIGVGKRMSNVKTDQWFASPDEAAKALPKMIEQDDLVLVKGSQGMRMEKISLALAADPQEAKEKLPRQNVRWRQIPFANP